MALEERRRRLAAYIDPEARRAEVLHWLETEIWSHVPEEERGLPHDSARDDALLGYGPSGLPDGS